MGLWSYIKSKYTAIDKSIGGILPGGYVKPSSTTSTTSTSTSTTSTSSGGGSYSGGGGGGGTVTTEELAPKTQDSVIVTDTSGGAVTTYIDEGGRITGRSVEVAPGYNSQDLVNLSSRSGGLVQETQINNASTYDSGYRIQAPESKTKLSGISGELGGIGLTFFGYKAAQEYGAPVITQQEAQYYGINPETTPVWVLGSGTSEQMIREATYAGNIPYTSRVMSTTDIDISNLATIRTGKEIYKRGMAGEQLTDIQIKDIYVGSVKSARESYGTKSFKTRAFNYARGLGQGSTAFTIKTTEFLSSIGFTAFSGRTTKVSFGGTAGQIGNYPVPRTSGFIENPINYISETFKSPSQTAQIVILAAGGLSYASRVRAVGAAEATTEAASFFSPFRIRGGIYGTSITENEVINIQSYKYTSPGGQTTKVYGGGFGDFAIVGTERYTQAGTTASGSGISFTATPVTEIRAGGGIIESGVRYTGQPYGFTGVTGGQGYTAITRDFIATEQLGASYPAGRSRILTSRGVTVYEFNSKVLVSEDFSSFTLTRGGGVSSGGTGPVTSFVSGKTRAIYKIERGTIRSNLDYGVYDQDFIYSPSGRYRLNPQFKGIEIDINKLGSTEAGYSVGTPGGKSSPEYLQSLYRPTTPSINLERPAQRIRTASIKQVTGVPSTTSATVPQTRIGPRQQYSLSSSTITLPKINLGVRERTGTAAKTAIISASALKIASAQQFKQTPIFNQGIDIATIPAQRTLLKTVPVLPPFTVPGFNFGSSFNPPTETFISPPPFSLGTLSNAVPSSVVSGGKSPRGYTPSFSALIFNIRGTYKGGGALSKSGIDFRPIVKGFKFKTGLNNVRLLRLR